MNNLKLAIALLAVSLGGNVYSQDLLSKVPAESKVVVALNGKGFFKHASAQQLNGILKRAGLFEKIAEDNSNFQSENIEELGIDIHAKSYLYSNVNDSLQFLGAMLPLKDKAQFESIFPEEYTIDVQGDLSTVYNEDRTLRISWNQNTIFLLTAVPMDNYFSREDIKQKFGLLEMPEYDYAADDYDYDYDYDAADSIAVAADSTLDWNAWEEAADTVYQIEEEAPVERDTSDLYSLPLPPEKVAQPGEEGYIAPPMVSDEFKYVDSVLEKDEYQDDYYLKYSQASSHNDSIKNVFVNQEVNNLMDRIIAGNIKSYKSKKMSSMKDNELLRIEIGSFDSLMHFYYPRNLLYGYMSGQPSFEYGYENINSTVVVDGNRMKILGDLSFDKEMTRFYKEIYNKKINPKFLTYLNDDALGFLSFNVNTEAYLTHMPRIVQRIYGGMDGKVEKIIDLFTTSMGIIVDEKAVAKVFKGDNLFILNGITQKEVKYIDYEYDDDYNYQEVEKTKMEKIPNYLWMFSSDDTRIFEKIFAILVTENNMVNHDGIYEIVGGKVDEFAPYILIQQGIVFLGNDLEQMQQIKDKTFKGNPGRFAAIAKKNKFSMLFNTKKVPSMVDDLDLPVHRSMESELKGLSEYGDIYMISNGMKGKNFTWEAGVDFPNTGKNALDYLLNSIDRISKSLND